MLKYGLVPLSLIITSCIAPSGGIGARNAGLYGPIPNIIEKKDDIDEVYNTVDFTKSGLNCLIAEAEFEISKLEKYDEVISFKGVDFCREKNNENN